MKFKFSITFLFFTNIFSNSNGAPHGDKGKEIVENEKGPQEVDDLEIRLEALNITRPPQTGSSSTTAEKVTSESRSTSNIANDPNARDKTHTGSTTATAKSGSGRISIGNNVNYGKGPQEVGDLEITMEELIAMYLQKTFSESSPKPKAKQKKCTILK